MKQKEARAILKREIVMQIEVVVCLCAFELVHSLLGVESTSLSQECLGVLVCLRFIGYLLFESELDTVQTQC